MARRVTLLLVVVVLVVVCVLPLMAILGKSVVADGRLTWVLYEKLLGEFTRHWNAIVHSLALSSLCAICVTVVGVPLGIVFGKTDLPLRRTLLVLLSIPLAIPPYILAVCWFHLLGKNSLLRHILPVHIVEGLSGSLFGLAGAVWVLFSAYLPVVMILTLVYLRAVSPRCEEAARLVVSWPGIVSHVTLPMIRPGILLGTMLVFLLVLGEVGVPMFLRYPVYPVEVLTQFAAFYDFGAAAAAATPIIAVTLTVLTLERLYLRNKTYRLRPTTSSRKVLRISFKHWRMPVVVLVTSLAAMTVVLPLLALMISSVSPFAYDEAWSRGAGSLGRSLMFASIGATCLAGIGFFCAYFQRHRALRLWRAMDSMTLLSFALPGAVIGVGLIALWNRPSTEFIYGSAAMVILAYLAQYTVLTSRIVLVALENVPLSLEEAAAMTGAPWRVRIKRIVLPSVLPGVLVAWLIGFIFCLRDLGASMLVYPAGEETLPIAIYSLMANGAPNLIAALCLVFVMVALGSLAILAMLLRFTLSRP